MLEMYACALSKVSSVWNNVSAALHSCHAEMHKHPVGHCVHSSALMHNALAQSPAMHMGQQQPMQILDSTHECCRCKAADYRVLCQSMTCSMREHPVQTDLVGKELLKGFHRQLVGVLKLSVVVKLFLHSIIGQV